MKLGMNMLLWASHVTEAHYPIFEKIKKAGFDGVELPLFEGDGAHYTRVGKELANQGLGCTTVTCLSTDATGKCVNASFTFSCPDKPATSTQKTSLTRDQELELGKQAAAEVERSMEVIHDARVEQWLNQIGQSLAKTPQANAYPYYFKLVNDESINAFALPGGPMYVHTGLIKAASNEGEVAGVLAHEMSHVALRHGAAQMGKQQTWGTLFGALGAIGGAVLSQGGQCTLLCQAAQMGAGIGGGATLNRFSRGYERDADWNGARMMAAAGYNPIELARFFDKLLEQQGAAAQTSGLEKFLSDHPATGNRIEYVQADIAFYPKKDYTTNTGQFDRVHTIVKAMAPPKPRPAELLSMRPNPPSRAIPTGYKDLATKGFSIAYPQT